MPPGSLGIALRDPLPLPSPAASVAEVSFYHPGYEFPHDLLFKLPKLDQEHSSPTKGIHYGTALAACQIVANNADGYLATDRTGQHRVNCEFDDVLTRNKYWFFVVGASTEGGLHAKSPYPIVPSFQDWPFPHQDQDDDQNSTPLKGWLRNWHQPNAAITGRCIITQASGLIEAVHLIPDAEREWFERNAMSQYGVHHDVDQSINKIDLRSDIRKAFDDHWFTVVPKAGSYAVHLLVATKISTREFAEHFHNRPVLQQAPTTTGLPRDVPREFLYARFARAVLLLLKPFVAQSAVSRRVARYRVQSQGRPGGEAEAGGNGPRIHVEWLSSEELRRQYDGGGTRSASPSKRKRGQGPEQENNNDSDEEEYIEDDTIIRRKIIDDFLEEEPERGRSRKRPCYDNRLRRDELR
ncbi:hypothetical protein F5X99DRAFT_125831 [Biscogniauxia marginata]|nr:hypothetical protein F5X99DRAFT_125831 [Biscogniauxia marginata]